MVVMKTDSYNNFGQASVSYKTLHKTSFPFAKSLLVTFPNLASPVQLPVPALHLW